MKPKHILVIRLSAMGDVAMTIPVLQQLLQQNPQINLTVLTRQLFAPLFEGLPRTTVFPVETKGRHKGILGLVKLFNDLRKQNQFDAVADLHNVLRSKIIRFLFRMAGVRSAEIDKGRKEKRQLTAKDNKKLKPLRSGFQRYADVFNALGFPVVLNTAQQTFSRQQLPASISPLFASKKVRVCFAPFAKHDVKMYPHEKLKSIIKHFAKRGDCQVFLLGGGREEVLALNEWEKELDGVINLAGKYSFGEELAIISNMDLVVSMDSANMHLASLYGVPVVSIWGATHPYAGFYGWGQADENAVQIDLYCRPCSVFGNKPCYRGDHACMQVLPEEMIQKKITEVIGK